MSRVAFFCPGYESLGIEYLSASLRQEGVETRLFFDPILFAESNFLEQDCLARSFSFRQGILSELKDYHPDLVCFSVISDNFQWACGWAKDLKAVMGARVIFGGIHPTSVPEIVIAHECVDYVCVGEGDGALVELTRAIAAGGDDTSIRNIWTKRNGHVFRNPVRPLIHDLDALPFPDKDLFYTAHPIFSDGYLAMASRGCAYSCAYCCNNVYHDIYKNNAPHVRRRSAGNIVAELALAKKKFAPRYMAFVDDCFNNHREWLFGFLQEYHQKVALPFSCYVFPDLVDEEQVHALKRAGCFKVQMGVQVVSEEKRSRILGRNSSQAKIARAIDLFRRYNIFVVCDAIFGFPDETEEELVELARFYIDHPPDHCENFWLRYYPRTEMTRWSQEKGFIGQNKRRAIESGEQSFGLIKRSEHSSRDTYARQVMMLLMLYPFFSLNVRKWWLNKRRYRKITCFPSLFMYVLVRLFHHPPFDLNTERTWKRYKYFLRQRILCL